MSWLRVVLLGLGAVAYVLSGFKHLRRRATRFRLGLDDRPPVERTGQGVLVGNLGRLQGGLPVMPDARPDDGLLDVAVLQTRSVLDWLTLAWRVLLRRPRKDPQLELFTARRVEISCDRPQPVERDGDPLTEPRDHLVIEVVPAAQAPRAYRLTALGATTLEAELGAVSDPSRASGRGPAPSLSPARLRSDPA